MVRHATIDRVIGGVDAETFFALACGSDTYAACHGGDHPGGMLDVRVGEWGGVADDEPATIKKALAAAAAALASAAPKKGWAARKAAMKGGGADGEDDSTTTASTAPPLNPAHPAVRALAYRMPPDWGDGWMTKLAPAMNIEEGHVRRRAAEAGAGGKLVIETSSKWSRLAPAAVIMRYTMTVSPVGTAGARVHYDAVVDTASLPLPPPIRAVIEVAMAASFGALVSKFVAFASDQLGGELVEEGEEVEEEEEEAAVVVAKPGGGGASPLLLSPRATAAPRFLAPPAPGKAAAATPATPRAAWSSLILSRHVRLVHQDTEGCEYWDAGETAVWSEAVWEGGSSGGTLPGTPTAAACA